MKDLKYSEILRLNKELEDVVKLDPYNISLLSNVVVHQGKEIIECQLRVDGINANIKLGDYDNIVQDSNRQEKIDATIIFWELANLIDGLHYKIDLLSEVEVDELEQRVESEIEFALKNLKNSPLVIINQFTSLFFSSSNIRNNKLEDLAQRLNFYLTSFLQPNLQLINIDKVISSVNIGESFDQRYYYSSKAPYSVSFFRAYAEFIKPIFMSTNGKAKKALIFDCDNTLWKGILGEDGINNIDMSAKTKDGAIFKEIQSIALSLSKQGIIIGLCSKNNPEDVNDVLANHPDMVLQDNHITIKQVNWSDKVTNIKKISKKLSIGLDSLVFVDDSPFEVNLVKEYLPDVTILQVPEILYEYPQMIRKNLGLFYNSSHSTEDGKKTEMYREQKQREDVKSEFSGIDDYLASLELKVTIFNNDESLIPRMSQLTQKLNQFNLTTKRYTESEIKNMVLSSNVEIFAFSLKDKFGDYGVTGLCIINLHEKNIAVIDNFLMSCRVIGRSVEYVFMDFIVNSLIQNKFKEIKSEFVKTKKNMQVEQFYDNCSFMHLKVEGLTRYYKLDICDFKKSGINYIEVKSNG